MEFKKYLRPKINRKIIKFFFENPSSIDTARGIATWINEDKDKAEKALKELVKSKIIVPHGSGPTSAYGCTTDAHILAQAKLGLKRLE